MVASGRLDVELELSGYEWTMLYSGRDYKWLNAINLINDVAEK